MGNLPTEYVDLPDIFIAYNQHRSGRTLMLRKIALETIPAIRSKS